MLVVVSMFDYSVKEWIELIDEYYNTDVRHMAASFFLLLPCAPGSDAENFHHLNDVGGRFSRKARCLVSRILLVGKHKTGRAMRLGKHRIVLTQLSSR